MVILCEGAKATVSYDFSQNGVASSVTAFIGRDGHLHITYKDAKFKAPTEVTETKKPQPVKQQPAVAISAEDFIFLLDTLPCLGDRGALPSFMQALGGGEQDGYFSGSYNNFDVQVEFNSGVVVKLVIEPQGKIGSYNSGIVLEKLYAIYGTPTYSFPTDYRWSFKSRPIRSKPASSAFGSFTKPLLTRPIITLHTKKTFRAGIGGIEGQVSVPEHLSKSYIIIREIPSITQGLLQNYQFAMSPSFC